MFTRPSFIAGTVCLFLAAPAVVATAEAQQPAGAAEVARLQAEIARLQAEAEAQQRLQTEVAHNNSRRRLRGCRLMRDCNGRAY